MGDNQSQIAGLLGQALPVQYQGGLEDIRRRKMIAEALQMQSMQAQPTEVITGHAVPQSKFGNIARLLTGGLGAYQSSQAQGQINQVQNQAANDEQSGAQQLSQMFQQNPQQAIGAARSSPFPSHKAMGQGWEKMLQERQMAGGKMIAEGGRDVPGGLRALSQGLPEGYTPPAAVPPKFGSQPGADGKPVNTVVNSNDKGVLTGGFGPGAGTQVSVDTRIPGQEIPLAMQMFKGELDERKKTAEMARDTIANARLAFDGLNEGAKVGGLGGVKQATRKFAQAFGLEIPATTPTEQVVMTTGQALLANARKLAPVTENDMKLLAQIVGSIDTDPQALEKALAVMTAASYKAMQDYTGYVDAASKNPLQTDYVKAMAGNAQIGYGLPPLGGNTLQRMLVLQELQARGGDLTAFQIGDKPFPADAIFDIGNRPAAAPVESGTLTGAKLERYNQLKKELGIP